MKHILCVLEGVKQNESKLYKLVKGINRAFMESRVVVSCALHFLSVTQKYTTQKVHTLSSVQAKVLESDLLLDHMVTMETGDCRGGAGWTQGGVRTYHQDRQAYDQHHLWEHNNSKHKCTLFKKIQA